MNMRRCQILMHDTHVAVIPLLLLMKTQFANMMGRIKFKKSRIENSRISDTYSYE